MDGTKINIHRGDELKKAFGVPSGAHCPQVLVSTLFDIIAKVPHDVVVGPCGSSEREQLFRLLGRVRPGDVDGVCQEIHAVALFVAITRYLMASASREHDVPYENISPKSGVLGFAAYIVRLLLACEIDEVEDALDQLLDRVVRVRTKSRPGRRYRRRSFQPARKWGPGGRRGG